jgi:phenylacetaldehyde dehydrogenase
MGPLVSEEQLNRVMGYLQSGRNEGARPVVGGGRAGKRGYFVQPTVLVNTKPGMKVVKEEIFGPVVCAVPFTDPVEVVQAANRGIYGLAAAVWTRDVSAHRLAAEQLPDRLVNCYVFLTQPCFFGGYRQSGWGREMGAEALELYRDQSGVCAVKVRRTPPERFKF